MRNTIEYRDMMEDLYAHFGNGAIVSRHEVATYCGRCDRWVKEHLNVGKNGIAIPILARRLVEKCG